VVTVPLDLLPDVTVGCEECRGQRFRPEVLECRVAGLTIGEVLESTVAQLADRFRRSKAISEPLAALARIGLGYVRLGQDSAALSAGERQRLKLAGLLAQAEAQPVAVLLDEPTAGLGVGEVEPLAGVLRELAHRGHVVIVVEHNLHFIAGADWVIELGPEGGNGGGRILFQAPPAELLGRPCHTGWALAAAGASTR
jgi:excinuclease ABC subunit A